MANNKPGVVCASTTVAACATVVDVTVNGSTAAVVSLPVHRILPDNYSRTNNLSLMTKGLPLKPLHRFSKVKQLTVLWLHFFCSLFLNF